MRTSFFKLLKKSNICIIIYKQIIQIMMIRAKRTLPNLVICVTFKSQFKKKLIKLNSFYIKIIKEF